MLVQRETVDRIAVLTLNNPPANGYSYAMHRELDAHVCDIRMDTAIDVVVIRGAGEKFFCAGADIGYLQSLEAEEKYSFCLHANETLLRLENTPKLVIAALNGHCVGGGLEIALACDLRLGRESGGRPNLVGLPEVTLGVLPGTGGTQRLTRIVGRAKALHLMVEGRNLSVDEAEAIGLVHAVLPGDDWWQNVLAYAKGFCAPQRAAGAVGLIKRAVLAGADLPLESGLAIERELQQRLFTAPDAKEGLAAFLGKRKPVFTGRPVPGSVAMDNSAPPPASPPPVHAARPESEILAATESSSPLPGALVPREGLDEGSIFEDGSSASGADPGPALAPDLDLARMRIEATVLDLLPTWLVRQYLVIPVRRDGDTLWIAMEDPGNAAALAAVQDHTGLEVRGLRAEQDALLAQYTMNYRL